MLEGPMIQELEELYVETKRRPATSEHVRELTLRSLKKRINRFKEEITQFEAVAGSDYPPQLPSAVFVEQIANRHWS
jgi:hypothetical protein